MTQPLDDEVDDGKFAAALQHVRSSMAAEPSCAIILGSGLGGLVERIEQTTSIPYGEIPGFHKPSALGHRGQMIIGRLESKPVVAMDGRFHRYEALSNEQAAFPVRLLAAVGVTRMIVSNAAGGLNPNLKVGDILVIRDHINLMGGRMQWTRRPQSVPMHDPGLYDSEMSRIAIEVGIERQFNITQGTYLATLGPTYETRSECRMMRRIGADVVGMSTVPEVLAAADARIRVLGLSLVSNVALPDRPVKADHHDVLAAAGDAEVKMEAIVREVVRRL